MSLFAPTSKIQRDRKILMDCDYKLVRHSFYVLIMTVFGYSICFLRGKLYQVNPTLAISLALGVIVVCFAWGLFLARFHTMYGQGPNRWRAKYFLLSLFSVGWWSFIIVCHTLTIGFVAETPILWMFTIIFQASNIITQSPYLRFCHVYQMISIVPPMLAALWVGGEQGYMYSLMFLIFFFMLRYQVEHLHDGFWDRLEANALLSRRNQVLEAENRNKHVSVDLNTEFLGNLGLEFRSSLNDILGGLTLLKDSELDQEQKEVLLLAENSAAMQLDLINNITDFAHIKQSSEIVIDSTVFDLRRILEKVVSQMAPVAHNHGIEIDLRLSSPLPMRVRTDVQRLNRIVVNMMSTAIKISENCYVDVEASFEHAKNDGDALNGRLCLLITDQYTPDREFRPTGIMPTQAFAQSHSSLWIELCRGMVESLGGNLEVALRNNQERQFRIYVPMEIANPQSSVVRSRLKLRNKKVVYYSDFQPAPFWVTEVDSWDLSVNTALSEEDLFALIEKFGATEHPIEVVMLNLQCMNDAGVHLLDRLKQVSCCTLKIIVCCRHDHLSNNQALQERLIDSSVGLVFRPVIGYEIHEQLSILCIPGYQRRVEPIDNLQQMGVSKRVLVADDHVVNQRVSASMLEKMGYQVIYASNGHEAIDQIKNDDVDIVFMDCHMPEMDGLEATKQIRQWEAEQGDGRYVPIIAMTAHSDDSIESLCFAAGMDHYLAKPIRQEDVELQLIRWLGC